MIKNSDVERALSLIERAGVCDELRTVLSPKGNGSKSPLSVEAGLTGTLLTVQNGNALTYANILRTLTEEISLDWQRRLGVRYRPQRIPRVERTITRRPIENMFNQIGERLGYLPGSNPDLPPGERKRRANQMQSIIDRLLDASKPVDLPPTSHYALDATGVWAWSRAKDDSRDQDARWGYKTPKVGDRELFFGYDVYAFVRVQPVGVTASYPHLVERLTVRPAASDEPDSTLPMIENMISGRYPIQTLLVDRAWSYKAPERWSYQLRDLGIEQVVDLHDKDHGVRDYNGLRVIAGWPHCPAMPEELVDIRRPPHLKLPDGTDLNDDVNDDLKNDLEKARIESAAEVATRAFVLRIEQRRAYATRRSAGPNAGGDERHECPADAGQVRCPLKALSMHLPADLPRVTDPPALEGRPSICQQRTVKVPGTVTPKVRQRHYWGSVDWIRSFARRTHVEGVFGNLKNRNAENITRGWLQVSGHARTSLMITLAAVAYNQRVARKWNLATGLSDDSLLQPSPSILGWREVTEEEGDEELKAA